MEVAMALEAAEWGAVAGVFVIVFAMMVYNQMVAKRHAGKSGNDSDRPSAAEHLSRFVVHEGDVVGEVVARDGDDLIVKHQGQFRAVPVAATKIANEEVHIHGAMDWDAAATAGQAWLERNRKGQDDEVSPQLTTSGDVKRPAFEAFQKRTAEVRGDEEE